MLFLSLLLSVFMVSWLPLVARSAGVDVRSAVLAVSAWNLGGILGCYLIGRFSARLGLSRTVGLAYGLGAPCVVLLGLASQSGAILLAAAFVAGMFVVGAQMCVIGLSASFYDSYRVSTGVGWALGAGKLGSVVGPLIGGVLIGAGMSMPAMFGIAGMVSLVAALAVLGLGPASKGVPPARPASARADLADKAV